MNSLIEATTMKKEIFKKVCDKTNQLAKSQKTFPDDHDHADCILEAIGPDILRYAIDLTHTSDLVKAMSQVGAILSQGFILGRFYHEEAQNESQPKPTKVTEAPEDTNTSKVLNFKPAPSKWEEAVVHDIFHEAVDAMMDITAKDPQNHPIYGHTVFWEMYNITQLTAQKVKAEKINLSRALLQTMQFGFGLGRIYQSKKEEKE